MSLHITNEWECKFVALAVIAEVNLWWSSEFLCTPRHALLSTCHNRIRNSICFFHWAIQDWGRLVLLRLLQRHLRELCTRLLKGIVMLLNLWRWPLHIFRFSKFIGITPNFTELFTLGSFLDSKVWNGLFGTLSLRGTTDITPGIIVCMVLWAA